MVRARGGGGTRRAVEDPLRARRRAVLRDPAESDHDLQSDARVSAARVALPMASHSANGDRFSVLQ